MTGTTSIVAWIIVAATLLGGCGGAANDQFLSEHRKANGLVIILPGIEGESPLNWEIRQGLIAAGVEGAMPIYRWGRPIPVAGILLNQVDVIGNRLEGAKIADMIAQYRQAYPEQPVYLVGHSGGGGVAVFAAESLPEGLRVDGLILLSASISANYDLSKALAHCKGGIVNFYNPADVGLLGLGTSVVGNVDGGHGPSAGLKGFSRAGAASSQESVPAGAEGGKLYQVRVNETAGDEDAHGAATRSSYVSANVAPWILSKDWPATTDLAHSSAVRQLD